MHRDGTTWVIAGVGGIGGGPPKGPVGRFKPKHPRARVATSAYFELGRCLRKHPRARVAAAAARMHGNGGNAGSGSTE